MKKYLIALLLISTLVTSGASKAKAETLDELLAEVGRLKNQVSQLSSQLTALSLGSILPTDSIFPSLTEADKATILKSLFPATTSVTTDTRSTTTTPLTFSSDASISVGQSSADVKTLQTLLMQRGLLSADKVTGYYGSATTAAVKVLQAESGIVSDGTVVGKQTRAVLAGATDVTTKTSGGFPVTATETPITVTRDTTTVITGTVKECASVATQVTITVDASTPPAKTYRAGTLGNDAGHFKITANCPVTITKLVANMNYANSKLSAAKPPVAVYYFYDGKTLLGAGKTSISKANGYFSLTSGQSKVITVKGDMTPQIFENKFQINLGAGTSTSGATIIVSPLANYF